MEFSNVLCLLPTTSAARSVLRYALDFCQREGAKLCVVDLVEPPPVWPEMPFPYEIHESLLESRRKRLAQIVKDLGVGHGVNISSKILSGSDVAVILGEVAEQRFDIVVKSAEPDDWSSRLFGSLDMRLLRKCPVPVLILQGLRAEKHHRVLVAVDPMVTDEAHQGLNHSLLAAGESLARLNDSELHVMHAWAFHPQYLAGDADALMTPNQVENLVEAAHQAHKKAFEKLMRSFKTKQEMVVHEHLEEGDPASAVAHLARSIKADLIVLGTVGRSGVRGLIMGNTAEKILHKVSCSVLALKPPGFSV